MAQVRAGIGCFPLMRLEMAGDYARRIGCGDLGERGVRLRYLSRHNGLQYHG